MTLQKELDLLPVRTPQTNGFKVGDIVVCLKGDSDWGLIEGFQYEVIAVGLSFTDSRTVRLRGVSFNWYESRFRLLSTEHWLDRLSLATVDLGR